MLARAGLRAASIFYGLAVAVRNAAYDRGWKRATRVDACVISVGNLTVGGTGKTPAVRYLAAWLAERGYRCVLLSRGYGRDTDSSLNDEARELARRLPDIPHLQGRDRAALARQAIVQCGAQVLVLDDGFQHRRLARDVDVVLIDALQPWGGGHLLPRGKLREPPRSLARATAVIVTRGDALAPDARAQLLADIDRWHPDIPVAVVRERPTEWVDQEGATIALDALPGPWQPFCGIGNPRAFVRTLEGLGKPLLPTIIFPDHHAYTASDWDRIAAMAGTRGAAALVCTEKDLVKAPSADVGGLPLWALRIDWEWLSGRQRLEELLENTIGHVTTRGEQGTSGSDAMAADSRHREDEGGAGASPR